MAFVERDKADGTSSRVACDKHEILPAFKKIAEPCGRFGQVEMECPDAGSVHDLSKQFPDHGSNFMRIVRRCGLDREVHVHSDNPDQQ
jgi:hypothetical protein